MQEALLCGGFQRLTAGCSRDVSDPWRQRCEDRFQSLHRGDVTTNHQAVAPFDAPHSPARTDIDVIDSCFLELRAPTNIVFVKRVTAIDNCAPSRKNLANRAHRAFRGPPAGTISHITFVTSSVLTSSPR